MAGNSQRQGAVRKGKKGAILAAIVETLTENFARAAAG